MSRLDAFLLLALIACALSVVNSTYQQRRVFVDLERAQGQQQSLVQDWTRLQYEQSALSKTSRVEDISSNQLNMSAVTAGRTEYLNEDGTAVSVAPLPASVSAVAAPPKAPKSNAANSPVVSARPAPQPALAKAVAPAPAPRVTARAAAQPQPVPSSNAAKPVAAPRAPREVHNEAHNEAHATHDAHDDRAAREARAQREDRAAAAAAAAIMSGKAGASGGMRP